MNDKYFPEEEVKTLSAREKRLLGIIAFVLICITALLARHFMANRPIAKRKPPQKVTPLVTVTNLEKVDYQIVIPVMGNVVPELEISLVPRVSGEIMEVNSEFVPGGVVKKGDVLVRIDPINYQAALAKARASLEQAKLELLREQGKQIIAEREWKLMGAGETTDLEEKLILRKPQLKMAQAGLRSAEAQMRKAQSDLAATNVKAPFNAIIRSKNVNYGDQASPQKIMATLIGTDTFWVEAAISIDRLPWLTLPDTSNDEATTAIVHTTAGKKRAGRLIKLLTDIEPGGRMAKILVEIDDPLDLNSTLDERIPLLIGEFVRLDLYGKTEKDVFVIPRTGLRENNTVWLLTDSNLLDIKNISCIWKDTEKVISRDLSDRPRLIISDLAGPVDGMSLSVAENYHSKQDPQ